MMLAEQRFWSHWTLDLKLKRVPLAQLRREASSNLSVVTIRRRLREADIKKWRADKRP